MLLCHGLTEPEALPASRFANRSKDVSQSLPGRDCGDRVNPTKDILNRDGRPFDADQFQDL